ncbi:MAG: WD40 repeat domain-containing protein [Pirellulales bacterium]|nr:WD40 repeat domain-containing protein [Pirellulales bacterium]
MGKPSRVCRALFVCSLVFLSGRLSSAAPQTSLADLIISPANSNRPPGAVLRFGFYDFEQGSGIRGFAISPDGRSTASSGYLAGAPIKIRQVGSRKLIAELAEDLNGSGSLAFSPDGALLAAGSNTDGSIRLWDMPSQKRVAILRTADYPQFSTNLPVLVAFAPDGKTLAAASPLGTVEVWHVGEAYVLDSVVPAAGQLKAHQKLSQAIAISPDGKRLAVATADLKIRIYDYPTLKRLDEITTDSVEVVDLAFSSDSRLLAYTGRTPRGNARAAAGGPAGNSKGAAVYDLDARQIIHEIAGSYGNSVAFVPGTERLLALGSFGNVTLTDLATKSVLYSQPTESIKLVVDPAGKIFITASQSGRIKYWDLAQGQEIDPHPGSKTPRVSLPDIVDVALPASGEIALTATSTGEIHVWDLRSGEWQRAIPDPPRELLRPLYGAVFLPDATSVIFGLGPHLERMEVADGRSQEWATYPSEEETQRFEHGRLTRRAVSADGSTVASLHRERPSNGDGLIRVWNVADGRLRSSVPVSKDQNVVVCLSPDGSVLYTVASHEQGGYRTNTIIQLYEADTGKPLRQIVTPGWTVFTHAPGLSPDGKQLALGKYGDTVQLWDLAAGKLTSILRGPLSGSAAVHTCFSPDGKRLLAGVQQRKIGSESSDVLQVWDVGERRLTHQFAAMAREVAFSHDSQRLAVALVDNSVLVYDLTQEHPQLGDAAPPTADELEQLYQQVGGGSHAYVGQLERYDLCERMVAGGDATIEFLRVKLLSPLEPEQDELYALVEQLRSEDRAERATASVKLVELGDNFWKSCAKSRQGPLARSDSVRLRSAVAKVPEQRRMRMVLHVVRHIPTPQALELLQEVIAQHAGDRSQRNIVARAQEMLKELADPPS